MKHLILLKGMPGVGKSTTAKALASKLHYVLLDKDEINNILFTRFGANKDSSEAVYEVLFYVVGSLLQQDLSVVVDCSLAQERTYKKFVNIAEELKARTFVVEVVLNNPAEVERRLNQRTDLPEHRIKTVSDIAKQGLSYEDYDVENLITVESTDPIEEITSVIVSQMS